MAVRITSGPARVVDSGSVTCFAGHPLALALVVEGRTLSVRFEFASDAHVRDVSVETVWAEDGPLLRLVNFDGPDGRGSALPVLLGEVEEDLLFLHFRVFRYGRTEDRTLHYTFFQVAKSDVGWQAVDPDQGRG